MAAGQLHTDQEIGLGWFADTPAEKAELFASCEQKLVVLEMAQVCSIALRGYTGLGGILMQGITVADVAAVFKRKLRALSKA